MTGKVISTVKLHEHIVDLRVETELNNPAPGRFVHIAVPGFSLRRPISLCGYQDGVARLVFAVKGQGTAALTDLQKDDPIDVLGALGNGFPGAPPVEMSGLDGGEAANSHPLFGQTVLVGGGIGLPPLLYYAQTHENTHAIAGFRSREFAILTKEFPSLDICTDDGTMGLAYYPHERLETYMSLHGEPGQVLACGPSPLLKAVAGVCRKHGLPCYVSMEERMACGVGACVVCACAVGGRYLRCCKDGPVFNAAEADWET
ncbi:MAG: dihydroorotate dehydrogenase electron transfer subunit [Oscillospiraceae bacterium]|nr:dihydroorotate dehydrogenase electron transfer subunit [Oscillospiraceae bacterium]